MPPSSRSFGVRAVILLGPCCVGLAVLVACTDDGRGPTLATSSGAPSQTSSGQSSPPASTRDGVGRCPPSSFECSCVLPYGADDPDAGDVGSTVLFCVSIPCGGGLCFESKPGLRYDCQADGSLAVVRGSCAADAATQPDAPGRD